MTATEVHRVSPPTEQLPSWYARSGEEVCGELGVDPAAGLDPAEVERRRARYGPNKLAEAKTEPGWHAFLRQYRDLMQLVLVGAAIVSVVALEEWHTAIVVFAVTLLNAILGLNQEGKAAESVAALQKMLVVKAHVRRGGDVIDIPAEELVPGDVVSVEAGDKIPADGRLLIAATLEIEEAALTGESTPAPKPVDPIASDARLSDRVDMAYMNSTVTRGRGEMVVTATGMETEVGRISGMLRRSRRRRRRSPASSTSSRSSSRRWPGISLALVIVLGLLQGDDADQLFLIGISVAVAAIPTELPAVVTSMLSLGTRSLAAKGAIVKRLRSVETLGSTSAICTDKTGTLTLNQMTARELILVGRRYAVDGEGYSTVGRILHVAGEGETSLEPFLLPMALANDATRLRRRDRRRPDRGGAGRARREGRSRRRRHAAPVPPPGRGSVRLGVQADGDLPRDGDDGRTVVRCLVKGAPDVLLARSVAARGADGRPIPIELGRERVLAENDASPAKDCACSRSPRATSTQPRSTPAEICSRRSTT